jgi:hypothetical protein
VGSFDDAIRQHLDLKRRRGADPHELAELERDALGAGEPRSLNISVSDERSSCDAGAAQDAAERRDVIDWSDGHRLRARRSTLSEETVEIDMKAVLSTGELKPASASSGTRRAYDWNADATADIVDPENRFEWETPNRVRMRGVA